MQPQPGQIGHRGHSHHLLEGVLQGPLAHPRRFTQVGYMKPFGGVRQRVVFDQLHDPAVTLPRHFVRCRRRLGLPSEESPRGFRAAQLERRPAFAERRTAPAVARQYP